MPRPVILQMEEAARTRPRATVIDEIAGIVRAQGFRTIAVAGLYPLQGELSTLVQAANVALHLGIDEMIHLGLRLRHARKRTADLWAVWRAALTDMWLPILASMLIVVSGCALFLLSDFHPHKDPASWCASGCDD